MSSSDDVNADHGNMYDMETTKQSTETSPEKKNKG
jgi:hypothetical protein